MNLKNRIVGCLHTRIADSKHAFVIVQIHQKPVYMNLSFCIISADLHNCCPCLHKYRMYMHKYMHIYHVVLHVGITGDPNRPPPPLHIFILCF